MTAPTLLVMKPVFLNTVTNEQLIATQTVTFIAFLLLAGVAAVNIIRLVKHRTRPIFRASVSALALAASLPVLHQFRLEYSLLNNAAFTTGVTTGYCEEFAKGVAISFEYRVDGNVHHGCNTFHPIARSDIRVPGGRYKVRYTVRYPEKGRMDFAQPENGQ